MQPEEGTGWLLELLSEVQLQQYFLRLRDDLNVTRLSHFEYVKNEDLEKIGMGRPGRWGHWPCSLFLSDHYLLYPWDCQPYGRALPTLFQGWYS